MNYSYFSSYCKVFVQGYRRFLGPVYSIIQSFYYICRNTAHHNIVRNIFCYNGTCGNYAVSAYCNTGTYGNAYSYPCIISDGYLAEVEEVVPVFKVMVNRDNLNVWAYENVVLYFNRLQRMTV